MTLLYYFSIFYNEIRFSVPKISYGKLHRVFTFRQLHEEQHVTLSNHAFLNMLRAEARIVQKKTKYLRFKNTTLFKSQ